MANESVAAVFAQHGKWISRFVIDGVAYGGWFDPLHDERIDSFFAVFPNVRTILELGSLEGGHTIAFSQRPGVERVVGIEGRQSNLARARAVSELLEARNVEFVQANLESADLRTFGRFDAVFCCGLLYHLPEPWKLLAQLPQVSPRAFFWTHYCEDADVNTTRGGYAGRLHVEGGMDEPLSGLSPDSFWPTIASLEAMLHAAGYQQVRILAQEPGHVDGPAVTIAATQSGV